MDAAASAGQIDMVQYLRSEGVGLSANLLGLAAESGQLEMVQFLTHDTGQPLEASVIEAAGAAAQIHVVRWLRANNCPCRLDKLCAIAKQSDCSDLLHWILDEC